LQSHLIDYLSIDSLHSLVSEKVSSEVWLKSIDINNDDIEGLYDRALSKIEQKYYNEAIVDLNNILQIDTSISSVFSLKGYCLLMLSNFDSALILLNKAIEIDGNNSIAFYARGRVFFHKNKLRNAMADFIKVIELNPNEPESSYFLGAIALKENDVPSAKKYFKQAIEIEPRFVEPYIGLCIIYVYSGQKLNALNILDQASGYLDDIGDYYLTRGYIQYIYGNYQKAINELTNCLKIDSKNFQALISLGILYSIQEKYSKSFSEIKHALLDSTYINKILIDDKYKSSFYSRTNSTKGHLMADSSLYENYWELYQSGYCKYITGDYDGAINDLTVIIRTGKSLYEPYELRGKILMLKMNYIQAENDFESAIRINGGSFFSFVNLAAIKYKQNDRREINKYLRSAMQLEPKNAETYKILASFNSSNPQVAIIYYNKVMELEPDNFNVLLVNAKLKKENGFKREAISDYKKLISKNPYFIESYLSIAELQAVISEFDSAKLYLKKAINIDTDYYEPYLMLGRIYSYENDYSNAVYYLKRAYDKSNSFKIYLEIGVQYRYMERYQDAMEVFFNLKKAFIRRGCAENEILAYCYYNLAICYDSLGNMDKTLKYYDLAIKEKPDIALFYYARGEIYKRMKKYNLSVQDYNKSISIDSLFYLSYIALGQQYSETSEGEKAIEVLNTAIQIDTNISTAYLEISEVYFSLSDFHKCKYYSEIAWNKDSTSTGALYYQTMSELNLGEIEKSMQDFYRFIDLNCKYKYIDNTNVLNYLDEINHENGNALEFKEILSSHPCNK
jgi:tetratricopeptide (TPR) repeat protein